MASSGDPTTFLSIPSTPFLLGICPFLDPPDILHLRLTCRRTYELLHEEEESLELWKLLLKRNFGIQSDFGRTLAIGPRSETVHSIFGVDPTDDDDNSDDGRGGFILHVSSPFESWKHWIKCYRRFHSFDGAHRDDRLVDLMELRNEKKMLMDGSFFLRAATLWDRIFAWLETAGPLGTRIKARFTRGMFYMDWANLRDRPGVKACQAVYTFCAPVRGPRDVYPGRRITIEGMLIEQEFGGLLGGYSAYNFDSCTHLIRPLPSALTNGRLEIACDERGTLDFYKRFCVDCNTGMIELNSPQTDEAWPAIHVERTSDGLGNDAVLLWLEEYANRLSSGRIGVGRMRSNYPMSILLYPRFPVNEPLTTTEGIQTVSRAVTRGIEVIASAVYVPQTIRVGWGFIYNIRIRLLMPGDGGYVSSTDRGFETCQLQSRHWQLRNFETGHVERVDGEGVIGMFPILREGGYTENGTSYTGTFSYTSCTGPMQGSFSGHVRFVPGTLSQPTGPAFDAELRPFALDNDPDFLY